MSHQIITGDCRKTLLDLQSGSVQACITSPPYFGLRDYGNDSQIGLEPTPPEYVDEIVAVFRGVRRVLRDDGTLWLNLGDSYARDPAKGTTGTPNGRNVQQMGYSGCTGLSVPAKNLLGIPWRVAFALQADGWILRQEIIWAKPNPMPESVRDRFTKSHEHLFLFAKSERYYCDHDAAQEPSTGGASYGTNLRSARDSVKRTASKRLQPIVNQTVGTHRENRTESEWALESRNMRDVWEIPTKPYKEAHFATFPEALVLPCVLIGSRKGDTILDPFTGSGTTGVVATARARDFIGLELNTDYAKLARDRIRDAVGPLFNADTQQQM